MKTSSKPPPCGYFCGDQLPDAEKNMVVVHPTTIFNAENEKRLVQSNRVEPNFLDCFIQNLIEYFSRFKQSSNSNNLIKIIYKDSVEFIAFSPSDLFIFRIYHRNLFLSVLNYFSTEYTRQVWSFVINERKLKFTNHVLCIQQD